MPTQSLGELRKQIADMADLVTQIIPLSFTGRESSDEVYEIEEKVNDYHILVDDNCFKFMALYSPNASILREVISIMKINAELERIADQSVSISRYHIKLKQEVTKLFLMEKLVFSMFKKSLDSYLNRSSNMAVDVIHSDQEINEINREIIQETLTSMKNNSITFEEGFSVIRISKNLERIGDLSTNICEHAIFLISGDDIRHNAEFKKGKKIEDKTNLFSGLDEK